MPLPLDSIEARGSRKELYQPLSPSTSSLLSVPPIDQTQLEPCQQRSHQPSRAQGRAENHNRECIWVGCEQNSQHIESPIPRVFQSYRLKGSPGSCSTPRQVLQNFKTPNKQKKILKCSTGGSRKRKVAYKGETETILSLVNNIGWWKTMKRWNYIFRTPGNIF